MNQSLLNVRISHHKSLLTSPAYRQAGFALRVRDRSLRARGSSEPEAGSETKGRNYPSLEKRGKGRFYR